MSPLFDLCFLFVLGVIVGVGGSLAWDALELFSRPPKVGSRWIFRGHLVDVTNRRGGFAVVQSDGGPSEVVSLAYFRAVAHPLPSPSRPSESP